MEKAILYIVASVVVIGVLALIYNNYNNTVKLEEKINELNK